MPSLKQHQERRTAGVCVDCSEPSPNARCERCLKRQRAVADRRRRQRAAKLQCTNCGKRRPVPGKTKCKVCRKKQEKDSAVRRIRRSSPGTCSSCGRPADATNRTCKACRKRIRDYYQAHRAAVFAYYGKECACCGEDEEAFLQIDHVDNNGNAHRREIGQSALYRWLVLNKFPPGFQTLCANCNFGKKQCGQCPHQRQEATTLKIANSG